MDLVVKYLRTLENVEWMSWEGALLRMEHDGTFGEGSCNPIRHRVSDPRWQDLPTALE
jgi:hypothetical protein